MTPKKLTTRQREVLRRLVTGDVRASLLAPSQSGNVLERLWGLDYIVAREVDGVVVVSITEAGREALRTTRSRPTR